MKIIGDFFMTEQINFAQDQKILFIGDSITDCDRNDPAYAPLGNGFVHFAANMLLAKMPELNLKILNRGIGGDTTRTLSFRWQRDCIDLKPDILSILIGINDLWWSYSDDPAGRGKFVNTDEYESNYRSMLIAAKDNCQCQFIISEPFMFCDDPENPMYRCLPPYIEVAHKLADEFDALLVPLQDSFEAVKYKVPAPKWSDDMVHPFTWAHAWIARQWLTAIGL